MSSRNIACLALAALAGPALAQIAIVSPIDRHAWGENIGWTTWGGMRGTTGGARVHNTFLSGLVWAENVGWINLGNGSPANTVSYANATGADWGVNLDANTGYLSGMAWGENIGWINFSGGAMATPEQTARITVDPPRRFYGFARGENVGWINFDHATHFVALLCPGDWNEDGVVDFNDFLSFLNDYNAGEPRADLNGDGAVDFNDFLEFLNLYNSGC